MRKDSREKALKILYSLGYDSDIDLKDDIYEFENQNEQDKDFCNKLIQTFLSNKELLLQELSEISKNYSSERMFIVDKTVILLAMCEMRFFSDIPHLVSIKEAMDLAKKYSHEDSVTFVNGILGAYKTKLEKENG